MPISKNFSLAEFRPRGREGTRQIECAFISRGTPRNFLFNGHSLIGPSRASYNNPCQCHVIFACECA